MSYVLTKANSPAVVDFFKKLLSLCFLSLHLRISSLVKRSKIEGPS